MLKDRVKKISQEYQEKKNSKTLDSEGTKAKKALGKSANFARIAKVRRNFQVIQKHSVPNIARMARIPNLTKL